jgi:NDP-sugar pyrophosphorylase family protein
MNAIVLAAGQGTRLGELGKRVPKVLVRVGDRPLLARHLELLEDEGVEKVVVNAFHLSSQIEAFARGYEGPIELICTVEPQLLGTAGGVRRALPHLGDEPFLTIYGDVLWYEPLASLIAVHARSRPAATLAVHEADFAEGKGIVEVDATGRVTRFVEKGAAGPGPFLINSGLYVVDPELVRPLPAGVPLDFGHDVLPAALQDGTTILTAALSEPVVDIGTEDGLARARALTA